MKTIDFSNVDTDFGTGKNYFQMFWVGMVKNGQTNYAVFQV